MLRDVAVPFALELDRDSAALDEKPLRSAWERLDSERRAVRERFLARAAAGELDTNATLARLDALRTLGRVAYHGWRIVHHLRRVQARSELPEEPREDRLAHAEAEVPE